MTTYKYSNILFVLVAAFCLNSCTKKNSTELSDAELPKNVLPKMKPVENETPKLSTGYILKTRNAIESFYNKNWSNNSANGSFLVAKNGQIIFEKYNGYADYSSKKMIDSNSPLHIASVSKVLTSAAILKLINAKKMDLDQKVITILKEFPYPDVTIRTLLNHRSGMRNYSYFTDKKEIWDKHKTLTNQNLLTLMANKNIDLEYKTDTHFSYCNTNYAMLALIIEKISGLSYKEAMKKIIFEPLGMKDTYVFDYETDKATAFPSYKGNWVEIGLDYLDAIYGDKNIYSTPRDLLKFDRATTGVTFLKPQLLNQIYTGYSNEHKGTRNYGLGIRMIKWDTGKEFYYHNGWWHGSTSAYIPLKNENVTIIALSNKFTRKTYNVRKLSALFGAYPFKLEDGGE
jgi:CubicO group peptidase (beta-lactamase class C family)